MNAFHTTVKTAISLPREDFRQIEKFRKALHKTRSQLLVEAFRAWLQERRKKEMDDHYAESYRKYPENVADSNAVLRSTATTWPDEKW